MSARAKGSASTLITSARKGRTLDLEERNKRYLITMAVRMVMLGLVFVVPGWWKLVFLVGGAILPVFAVVLANHYEEPTTLAGDEVEESGVRALPGTEVISGTTREEA